MRRISRREMLQHLGASLTAAAVLPLALPVRTRAQAAIAESFISFTAEEAQTVKAIVARIIPSDENGPGALEARADRFIDRALAGALKASRPAYSTGLMAVNAAARSSRGKDFSQLSAADQDAVLTSVQQTSAQFFNLIRAH